MSWRDRMNEQRQRNEELEGLTPAEIRDLARQDIAETNRALARELEAVRRHQEVVQASTERFRAHQDQLRKKAAEAARANADDLYRRRNQ